jgi:hypothetical protein
MKHRILAATVAVAATAFAASTLAQAPQTVRLNLASAFPTSLTLIGEAPVRLSKTIEELSDFYDAIARRGVAVAEAARRAPDADASVAAQLGLIRDRLGWEHAEAETPRAVLERLSALAACIAAEARVDTAAPTSGDPCAELARFEGWYAERFGSPFWALFDRYSPETPVVDF